MAKAVEIRALTPTDDRSDFRCGQADLDRFFEYYAGQNQFKLHLSVTYLAVVDARIAGFATVSVASLERANLPSARLRRRLPNYPLPVLRLGRLGVDTRAQRMGIGSALLRHVLGLAMEQRDHLGCVGVVADAKPDAVPFYEGLGFVALEGVREGLLSRRGAAHVSRHRHHCWRRRRSHLRRSRNCASRIEPRQHSPCEWRSVVPMGTSVTSVDLRHQRSHRNSATAASPARRAAPVSRA